jgi:hypothetical protein
VLKFSTETGVTAPVMFPALFAVTRHDNGRQVDGFVAERDVHSGSLASGDRDSSRCGAVADQSEPDGIGAPARRG